MAILSEQSFIGDVLKNELGIEVLYSRDKITVLSGQNLALGTVLGAVTLGTATPAVKQGGNTGTGTLVMDPTTPLLTNAETGVYTVTVNPSGTMEVFAPSGAMIGDAPITSGGATVFSDRLKFTLNDTTTHFVTGDGFTVTVAAGSLKYVGLNPAALDGSQNAAGVLLATTNATAGDMFAPAVTRGAMVADNRLVWPGGITNPQKLAAINQLLALGIKIRTGV